MILDSNGNLITADPGFSHGYGLTAVRKAVEESNGKMTFTQEGGKFAVSVLLKTERQPIKNRP
jgi:sensor histidine kinase regulating citrate/malate metabolism